jgi:hypothetical protein
MASITTAPTVALGRFSKRLARNRSVSRTRHAFDERRHLRALARGVGYRGLREAAVACEATHERRRARRRAPGDQLRVPVGTSPVTATPCPVRPKSSTATIASAMTLTMRGQRGSR